MHCTLNSAQTRAARNESNVPKQKSSQGLTVPIYILCGQAKNAQWALLYQIGLAFLLSLIESFKRILAKAFIEIDTKKLENIVVIHQDQKKILK